MYRIKQGMLCQIRNVGPSIFDELLVDDESVYVHPQRDFNVLEILRCVCPTHLHWDYRVTISPSQFL